jgi:hypothetical protein
MKRTPKPEPVVTHKPQLVDPRINQVVRPVPVAAPIPEVETVIKAHAAQTMSNQQVQELLAHKLNVLIQIMKRTKQMDWFLGGLEATANDMRRLLEGKKTTVFGRSA